MKKRSKISFKNGTAFKLSETTPAFHSFLKSAIAAYLELRQSLGYVKNMALFRALQDFDYYLVYRGIAKASQMDEALLVAWIHFLGSRYASRTKNRRRSAIRGLFRCLMHAGIIQSNPADNIPRLKEKLFLPKKRRRGRRSALRRAGA
ncbi:MAG: site-specific integrase [Elusimicrobia bacterium]|nr:site-specific integrase [Elusimicrobiota bacterium]